MKPAVLIGGVAIAALLAGGAWWSAAKLRTTDAGPQVTRMVSPEQRTIAATVLATGIVRLRVGAEVRVGAQLSGIVDELNVIVGSRINKGDVIARIDSRGLQARLAQAEAQVRVTEQEVRRAEVEVQRARQLAVKNLAPANDLEDRELDLSDVTVRLEKARRDVAVVASDMEYSVIRAPITGIVASVSTQEGETVAASFNTPTFATIIAEDSLELVAMVDETDIGAVEPGNQVFFTVEAYPATEFVGVVKQIAPKGTILSGVVNFEVMIGIESPLAQLKPDMTANVSIRTAEREALVLPTEAIERDGFEQIVHVEQDGQLVRRSVSVGTREEGYTEIRQGLTPADKVAIIARSDNNTDNG